jgi:hypothetical protein
MANAYVESQLRARTEGDGQLEICGPTAGTEEIEVQPLLKGTVGTIVYLSRLDVSHLMLFICARTIVRTNSQEDVWQRQQSRQKQ